MTRYRGNNLDRIYKASNNSIINVSKNVSKKRLKACLLKAGYDTEFEAEVTAAKRNMNSYKCPYCPHYHLTSRKKK